MKLKLELVFLTMELDDGPWRTMDDGRWTMDEKIKD